jgi:hypothetical protein
MGTGALFLGIKRLGREAEHSPPSIAEVKNADILLLPERPYGVMLNSSTGTALPFPLPNLFLNMSVSRNCIIAPVLYRRVSSNILIISNKIKTNQHVNYGLHEDD